MGITASWHNAEKTIIRLEFVTPWTWEDFMTATRAASDMARPLGYTVGIISAPSVPAPKGNPLPYFSESIATLPENVCIIAVVGANYFTTAMTRLAVSVLSKYREKMVVARNIVEAEAAVVQKLKRMQSASPDRVSR